MNQHTAAPERAVYGHGSTSCPNRGVVTLTEQTPKTPKPGGRGFRKEWVIWLRIAAAAILTLTGYLLPETLGWLRVTLHALAFLSLSLDMILRAVSFLRKGHILPDPFLLFFSALVMFFIGQSGFAPLSLLVFRSMEGIRAELVRKRPHARAKNPLPDMATVLRNGQELELPAKRVLIGDTVLVRQGDPIPLDGVVLEGESDLSVTRLTGETRTVPVTQGDRVFAGSVNGISVLMIRVTAAEEDSALHHVRRISQRAREERSEAECGIARLGLFYTCGVAAAALLLAVLPLLILNETDPAIWLGRAMAMLAAGGVSGLLFAITTAYTRCAARLFDVGCAITTHRAIDTLSRLSMVVMDKAQLSERECSVVSAVTMPGVDTETLNRCASIVYYHHNDQISHSLRRFCGDVGYPPDKYREIPGYGLSATFSGQMIHAGSGAYLERMGIKIERTGANTLHIALDNNAIGYYILSETLRPDAAGLFTALRAQGLKTALFSPDPKDTAQEEAAALGADLARGEVLSREKGAELQKLRENHPGLIAYVGGAGDSGALRSADVGILCDGLRNPAGPDECGAVLLSATPEALPEVLRYAVRGHKDILHFVGAGAATKCVLPVLAALGLLPLPLAVLCDGLLTVILTALSAHTAEERGE